MLFKKAPGFAGSLFFSLILHGLALLAADLFWGPVFPGRKDAAPGPVRLAVTIQGVKINTGENPGIKEDLTHGMTDVTAEVIKEKATAEAIKEPAIAEERPNDPAIAAEMVTEAGSGWAPPAATVRETEGKTGITGAVAQPATGAEENTAVLAGDGKAAEHNGEAGITWPVVIDRTPPAYPRTARENNWEGSVLLDALILPDGTVGDLRVERSSGYGLLDAAALEAVKDWRYQPALKGNTPVACRIKINIQFVLEE